MFTKKGNLTRHIATIHEKSSNQQEIVPNRKRKLSASNETIQPTAKKAKKSSKCSIGKAKKSSKLSLETGIKTTPGSTPKKYASEPHTKLSRKKVNVEVKMAEDGTHNPDR